MVDDAMLRTSPHDAVAHHVRRNIASRARDDVEMKRVPTDSVAVRSGDQFSGLVEIGCGLGPLRVGTAEIPELGAVDVHTGLLMQERDMAARR
ncbi:hypothetical protein [Bradyrhizobium sp.]|uniref:hypothetical protein n=1 Tax=Bradyrhizobium sp. TaxID=376 RepID=UPI00359F2E2B